MKKLTLLLHLMLVSVLTMAQNGTDKRNFFTLDREIKELFLTTDVYLEELDIESLTEEDLTHPSVILNYFELEHYDKYMQAFQENNIVRRQILINSQEALEEYSELNFQILQNDSKWGNMKLFGVKVIKAGGEVIEISSAEYIYDGDAEGYKSKFEKNPYFWAKPGIGKVDLKLAVKNLEIGDVIDIVSDEMNFKTITSGNFEYRASLKYLATDVPMKNALLKVKLNKKFRMNFVSINGAPDIQLNATESTKKGLVYDVYISNTTVVDDADLVKRIEVVPAISYAIGYYEGKEDWSSFAVKPAGEYQGRFEESEIIERVSNHIKNNLDNEKETLATQKANVEWIQEYWDGYISDSALVFALYYRNQNSNSFARRIYQSNRYYTTYSGERNIESSLIVNRKLQKQLAQRGIESKILVFADQTEGDMTNSVRMSDLNSILKVELDGEVYYYDFYNQDLPMNDIYYINQGVPAYSFDINLNVEEAEIPKSTCEDNVYSYQFIVTTDLKEKQTNLVINTELSGTAKRGANMFLEGMSVYDHQKYSYRGDLDIPDTIPFMDLGNEVKENYQNLVDSLKNNDLKPSERRQLMLYIEEYEEGLGLQEDDSNDVYELKLDLMKEYREGYYDIESYDAFNLYADGRSNFFPTMQAREEMTLNELVEKVGPNYVLNLGEILYDQLDVEDEDREFPVSMYDARTIHYQMVVNIPEGYTLSGYKGLNQEIDNETGSLKISYKEEGDKLVLDIYKKYKVTGVSLEDWPKMYEWLSAANALNDIKLVFKPTNS